MHVNSGHRRFWVELIGVRVLSDPFFASPKKGSKERGPKRLQGKKVEFEAALVSISLGAKEMDERKRSRSRNPRPLREHAEVRCDFGCDGKSG